MRKPSRITYDTGSAGANVGPDLSVPAFGRMLLALAEATGGTTPARAHAALQAAGARTVNRVALSPQAVRQMACRLEREGLALINRGIGNDWTITAAGMVPAADSTTTSSTSTTTEEATMSTKLTTSTCTTCGATVTTKNMARHRKSPACTVNGKVRSEAATIAKATAAVTKQAPVAVPPGPAGASLRSAKAAKQAPASKPQVAPLQPKQPAAPKAKADAPQAKAAAPKAAKRPGLSGHAATKQLRDKAADKPQHQPGERGYRAPNAGVVGADPRLPPVGTVITKLYKGTEHRVTILADGVEHLGVKYKNLRKVVKVITGANNVYSLLFFGVVPPKGKADAQAGA